jgi:hypothetical protein
VPKRGIGLLALVITMMSITAVMPTLPGRAAATSIIPASVQAMADAILDAPTLQDALLPTDNVLANSGMAIIDDARVIVVPAVAPAAGNRAYERDALALAFDARIPYGQHGLNLTQVGRYLKGFGAPIPKGADPALAVREMLAAWVTTAATVPDDPTSFNPLYLAAVASRQGIDLSTPTYDPADLSFSNLDLQVLSAGMTRNLGPGAAAPVALSEQRPVGARAAAAEPCSEVGKKLEAINPVLGWAWNFDQGLISDAAQDGASALISYTTGVTKEVSGKVVERVFKSMDMLMRILKLAQFYGSVSIRPFPFNEPVAKKATKFSTEELAVVGLNEAAAAELAAQQASQGENPAMEAVADCYRSWGFPALPQLSDLAEGMAKWRVKWKVSPEYYPGLWNLNTIKTKWASLNQRTTPLRQQLSPTERATGIYVDILPQSPSATASDPMVQFEIPIDASIDASGIPDSLPFVGDIIKSTLKGTKIVKGANLDNPAKWIVRVASEALDPFVYADATLAIAAEMFKSLVQPTAHTVQTVTEHVHCATLPSLPRFMQAQVARAGTCGPVPKGWTGVIAWSIHATDDGSVHGAIIDQTQDGTMDVNLTNLSTKYSKPVYLTDGATVYNYAGTGSDDLVDTWSCNWTYSGSGGFQPIDLGTYGYDGAGYLELQVSGTSVPGSKTCTYPYDPPETTAIADIPRWIGSGDSDPWHAACYPTGVDPTVLTGPSDLLGAWDPATQSWTFDCSKTVADPTTGQGYTTTITGTLQPTFG